MAEGQAEDAPLLGTGEQQMSPAHTHGANTHPSDTSSRPHPPNTPGPWPPDATPGNPSRPPYRQTDRQRDSSWAPERNSRQSDSSWVPERSSRQSDSSSWAPERSSRQSDSSSWAPERNSRQSDSSWVPERQNRQSDSSSWAPERQKPRQSDSSWPDRSKSQTPPSWESQTTPSSWPPKRPDPSWHPETVPSSWPQTATAPSWHADTKTTPSWTSDTHAPSWPSERWTNASGHLIPPPQPHTPKLVRSQSSMDSGCECDGDSESPPNAHSGHTHTHGGTNGSHNDPAGFSPLSPSQPGGSGPPSPGPSAQAAPQQKCVCDTTVATLHDPHAKVTFTFHDDDEDDYDHHSELCSGDVLVGMNAIETASLSGSEPGEDFKEHIRHHPATAFPRVPSYSKTGVLSASSSTASMPMCRICHHPQGDGLDTLISPCRCAGTMQFIHQGCLNKWLEVKRCKKAPACELCNYQFHRHKKFRLNHWKLPSCSRADKILHTIFLVCLVIMSVCATITIICFKQVSTNPLPYTSQLPPSNSTSLQYVELDQDRVSHQKKPDDAELTKSEVVTLTCGVLFFVAFFVAMYVEVKARNTLYRLFAQFLYLNQTWHIAEYDRRRDSQVTHAPV